MIGPILFYWKQPGGIWEPVALRQKIDLTEEYFAQIHEDLAYARCNFLLIQPWGGQWGLGGLQRHRNVWVDYPEVYLAPHLDGYAFRNFPVQGDPPWPVPAPSYAQLEDEPWGPYWIERLDLIPSERWLTFRGKRVVTLTGNFAGWDGWPRDSLERIADQLERRYGYEYALMPTWTMRKWFSGVEYECNMFVQREHLKLTPPTAAVRPGFQHLRSAPGDRYIPRRGGRAFRCAVRTALQKAKLIFIESVNERVENSNIERCYRAPRKDVPAYWNPGERWGWGRRRYWRIIRQEVRHAA